jgi:hypothetical protein
MKNPCRLAPTGVLTVKLTGDQAGTFSVTSVKDAILSKFM